MTKKLVINAVVPENVRVAETQDGHLLEFFQETQERFRTRSNIYWGKIQNVNRSLDACFIEYGDKKQGFLPLDAIKSAQLNKDGKNKRPVKIDDVAKRGQFLIVQVEKEPMGDKGARLTMDVSLAGRYLVLTPFSEGLGVSRKISDQEQRQQCRELGKSLKPPKGMGIIIRTVGRGQNKRSLSRDMNFLVRLWKEILKRSRTASSPCQLNSDAELVQRVLRDYYTNEIDQVWIDDAKAMEKAQQFFKLFMPRQKDKLRQYQERVPIFSHFEIESQIEDINRRKVELPAGGSIVIDQTEALVAIDVNSGRSKSSRGQEENAYETNLEAAVEIGRQLRLRNLGGIIVIDFIDMLKSAHKSGVERALREAMRNDKARRQVGKISAFGLCTMTRQRLDQSIRLVGFRECPTCRGDGVIRSADAIALRLLRSIQTRVAAEQVKAVRIRLHPEIANYLQNKHRPELLSLEREFGVVIEIDAVSSLLLSEERIEFRPQGHVKTPVPPAPAAKPSPPPAPAAASEAKKERQKSDRRPQPAGKKSEPESKRPSEDAKEQASVPKSTKKRRRRRRKKPSAQKNTAPQKEQIAEKPAG